LQTWSSTCARAAPAARGCLPCMHACTLAAARHARRQRRQLGWRLGQLILAAEAEVPRRRRRQCWRETARSALHAAGVCMLIVCVGSQEHTHALSGGRQQQQPRVFGSK
jgi:hypothetical protein